MIFDKHEQSSYSASTIERFIQEYGNITQGLPDEGRRVLHCEVNLYIHFVDAPSTPALGFEQLPSDPTTQEAMYRLIYVHPSIRDHREKATDPANQEAGDQAATSGERSVSSQFLQALQRIRVTVSHAQGLVKYACERSTDIYQELPAVDLPDEIWEMFHPLTTIGDQLEIIQSELELVEATYHQFIEVHRSRQSEDEARQRLLSMQEIQVSPSERLGLQLLPFVVHITIGTNFGQVLSASAIHELMDRYHGQAIEHTLAFQGTKHSILTFFADLREAAPALAHDLSCDAIDFYKIRKPSLNEYRAAIRFLHRREAAQQSPITES